MSGFRITPIEVLVILICIGLVSVLVLPALLLSREESRSLTCQSHQVKLVLGLRERLDSAALADPSQWPKALSKSFTDPSIIEHCPSDTRRPPAAASYGINPLVAQFGDQDAAKITFLDYNALVVSLTGDNLVKQWGASVAPRHFEFVNVAFYDSHIESKEPTDIVPGDSESWSTLWLP
ncbi:MAG: type II secretion system GspH family protein [Planctomycetales bacterium]